MFSCYHTTAVNERVRGTGVLLYTTTTTSALYTLFTHYSGIGLRERETIYRHTRTHTHIHIENCVLSRAVYGAPQPRRCCSSCMCSLARGKIERYTRRESQARAHIYRETDRHTPTTLRLRALMEPALSLENRPRAGGPRRRRWIYVCVCVCVCTC